MRTATAASASNRPKIRPSASLMAPSIRSSGTTSRASWSAVLAGRRRASAGAPGAKRTAKTSAPGDAEAVVASLQPTSIASPLRPGIDRSTIPAIRQVELPAVGGRDARRIVADRQAERSARLAGMIVAPPASSAASAASRSPATNVSRPSAAMSAPTTAAASVRVPSKATSKVAIGLTRATPGTSPRQVGSATPSSSAIGRIEVTTRSPGTTSAIQPAAAARACWPTPPSATIIASPMVRPPRVSAVRLRSRTTELRASRSSKRSMSGERRPGDPGDGRQHERDEQGGDEQDRVDDERLDDAGRGRAARQDDDADERDGHEHAASQRSRAERAAGRSSRARERLDRLDAAGATGRLEGGGEGHADARRGAR